MKLLYLIRHAKSSWSFDQLDDFHRPLGVRGRRDLVSMSKMVSRQLAPPELIISSPASRAFYTALYLADAWHYDESKIQLDEHLYLTSAQEHIRVLRHHAKNENIVALAGHNPELTLLANTLTGAKIENIPTCSLVGIAFEHTSWDDALLHKGKVLFFHTPKNIN